MVGEARLGRLLKKLGGEVSKSSAQEVCRDQPSDLVVLCLQALATLAVKLSSTY